MDEEELQFETVLAEIRLASADLADFLVWVADHDDIDHEEYIHIVEAVYSYARKSNEQSAEATIQEAEEE